MYQIFEVEKALMDLAGEDPDGFIKALTLIKGTIDNCEFIYMDTVKRHINGFLKDPDKLEIYEDDYKYRADSFGELIKAINYPGDAERFLVEFTEVEGELGKSVLGIASILDNASSREYERIIYDIDNKTYDSAMPILSLKEIKMILSNDLNGNNFDNWVPTYPCDDIYFVQDITDFMCLIREVKRSNGNFRKYLMKKARMM